MEHMKKEKKPKKKKEKKIKPVKVPEKMWEELNKDDQEEIRALIEYKLRRKKREKERKSAV